MLSTTTVKVALPSHQHCTEAQHHACAAFDNKMNPWNNTVACQTHPELAPMGSISICGLFDTKPEGFLLNLLKLSRCEPAFTQMFEALVMDAAA